MKWVTDLKSKKDLKKMNIEDLNKELAVVKNSLYLLQMKLELNELKQPILLKQYRRQVALINTLISEKIFE